MNVSVLMKSLANIFNSSNFYKEARMVSFLDRLLDTITIKIKKWCSLGRALREANEGSRSAQSFLEEYITSAREIVLKYDQQFFLKELM